jgi:sugar/nucleoside kinase (ribokinase family)
LSVLANADFIYTTPTEIAALRCGDMKSEDIIDHCRKNGVRLVFDLDVDYIKDGDQERFKRLDIAFFNEVGFNSYRGSLDYRAAAERLLSYGLELIVVTLAEKGCAVYTREETFNSPAFKVDIVDVTGAGDTFCSSFLFALSLGKDIKYAAKFANAAASICVGKLGARAGAVSREVIERMMRL